jgi:hypothetical protein
MRVLSKAIIVVLCSVLVAQMRWELCSPLTLIVAAGPICPPNSQKPQPGETAQRSLTAKAGRTDTKVRFTELKNDTTIIDVISPFGIDRVTLGRISNKWPPKFSVHLHLRGLESFKVSSGETTVEWKISSVSDNALSVILHQGKQDLQVSDASPYFGEVISVGDKKTIPLNEGYFEVKLPTKLLETNPVEIKLSWIDFYRG